MNDKKPLKFEIKISRDFLTIHPCPVLLKKPLRFEMENVQSGNFQFHEIFREI